MPIYERLDSTTLRGSGRGRWRRNAVAGMSAVMAAGAIGGGVAQAATSPHKAPLKPVKTQSAAARAAGTRIGASPQGRDSLSRDEPDLAPMSQE